MQCLCYGDGYTKGIIGSASENTHTAAALTLTIELSKN
jgi:hypothetical protein